MAKMIGAVAFLAVGAGRPIGEWTVVSPHQAMSHLRDVWWDFNTTCIEGKRAEFRAKLRTFDAREARAWNTAVLVAVESGFVPPLIASGRQPC